MAGIFNGPGRLSISAQGRKGHERCAVGMAPSNKTTGRRWNSVNIDPKFFSCSNRCSHQNIGPSSRNSNDPDNAFLQMLINRLISGTP